MTHIIPPKFFIDTPPPRQPLRFDDRRGASTRAEGAITSMGYQRSFDEEPTRVSELACVNDGFVLRSYQFALTTEDLHVPDIPPSIYRAFLEGMDPSLTVALSLSRTDQEVSLPIPNTWGGTPTPPEHSDGPVAIFPGNMVVRVRVMAGMQTLNIRMISGTGTLYLVPVLMGL